MSDLFWKIVQFPFFALAWLYWKLTGRGNP